MIGDRARRLVQYIRKSKFVRSVFLETISVFLVVIIITVIIMFTTFRSELNERIVADQGNRLDILDSNISLRMEEVTSIAYNVGQDQMFYIEPVDGVMFSNDAMSTALSRYLVGNRFIEHLAFYRLSEPDVIYSTNGVMSLGRFWDTYLICDNYTEESFIEQIRTQSGVQLLTLAHGGGITYFAYVCPLPEFSTNPLAFVIALIPRAEFADQISDQLAGVTGMISVFDVKGRLIYSESTLDYDVPVSAPENRSARTESKLAVSGNSHMVMSQVSKSNGWSYVSVVKLSDVFGDLSGMQAMTLISLVFLMIAAIFIVLLRIIKNYKPISNLAMNLNGESGAPGGVVDEKQLLTNTIETLRSDSEQKQRFESAYNAAHEANKAKSVFLSNMSHDIRTPMNAVLGMIGLARKHADNAEYVSDCLKKADTASHYLLELINNVLDMSRIESGKIVLTEDVISLPDFMYGLITIVNSNIGGKSQRFIVDTDGIRNEKVMGDSLRLTQICMNILSNAVKYTPDGGTIRMRLTQFEPDERGACEYGFTFSDNGIGMSPEFVEHVFDSFVREVSSGTSKIEGTGLGMAIAKNLVDMMGGTISCESAPGKGTTFALSIPMKTAPDDIPEGFSFADAPSILVISDDIDIRTHQAAYFSGLGFSADCAATAAEALDMMNRASGGGRAYRYLLINLSGSAHVAEAFGELLTRDSDADVKVVIAASEFSVFDNASFIPAGNRIFMRTPLFRSTIISTLVKNEAPGASAADGLDDNSALAGKRALLAEDNDINRMIANTLLSDVGVTVVEARNGVEAVEAFAARQPNYFDFILMDVQMPEMDGITATLKIRAMNRKDASEVPIFAMTANTFDEDVRAVMRSGMNGHLGKPYSPDDLYKLLREAVQK